LYQQARDAVHQLPESGAPAGQLTAAWQDLRDSLAAHERVSATLPADGRVGDRQLAFALARAVRTVRQRLADFERAAMAVLHAVHSARATVPGSVPALLDKLALDARRGDESGPVTRAELVALAHRVGADQQGLGRRPAGT